MKRRAVRFGAITLTLAAAVSAACHQTLSLPRTMHGPGEAQPGQPDLRREYWDTGPTRLRSEIEGLVQRGGAFEKHGRERSFFRGGALEFERHWLHGEPAGTWLAWWENGTLRSRCEFTPDAEVQPMFFWHENGQPEARGPAHNGRRIGRWEFFRADGSKESAGDYLDGLREGEWTFWDECGNVIESSRFERGVKVGSRFQR